MSTTTASPDRHLIQEMAAALRRTAREADVEFLCADAQRVATMAKGAGEPGVSRLGIGVVIHTVPATRQRRPVVVGCADNRGQCIRTAADTSRFSKRTRRSRAWR